MQGVAFAAQGTLVGLAGFRVVELAAFSVRGVGEAKAGSDGETAEGTGAEGGVRVVEVGSGRSASADGDESRADEGAARRDGNDGAAGLSPVAAQAPGGSLRAQGKDGGREEQCRCDGEQLHAGIDARREAAKDPGLRRILMR